MVNDPLFDCYKFLLELAERREKRLGKQVVIDYTPDQAHFHRVADIAADLGQFYLDKASTNNRAASDDWYSLGIKMFDIENQLRAKNVNTCTRVPLNSDRKYESTSVGDYGGQDGT